MTATINGLEPPSTDFLHPLKCRRSSDTAHSILTCFNVFQSFESTVNPILNKPKPKEKTPPPAANQTAGDGQHANAAPDSQNSEQMDVE